MTFKHMAAAAVVIGCAHPGLVHARTIEPSIYNLVTSMAQAHGVDPALAHAVVKVDPVTGAVLSSAKTALPPGAMAVMP